MTLFSQVTGTLRSVYLKKTKPVILVFFGMFFLAVNAWGVSMRKDPVFDKTGITEPEALTIIEINAGPKGSRLPPWGENHDDWDAVHAAHVLQGLVNRTSPDKLLFLNDGDRRWDSGLDNYPTQAFLDFFPELQELPKTHIERVPGKNGGLKKLLSRYQDYINGFVIWDPNTDNNVAGGTMGAAALISSQKDGLPVSPALKEQIVNWGYDLPVLVDLRDNNFSSDHEVLNWTNEHYWSGVNKKNRVVYALGNDSRLENQTMIDSPTDLAVMSGAFCFSIYGDTEEDKWAVNKLLSDHFREGEVAVIGIISGEFKEFLNGTLKTANSGWYGIPAFMVANLSVLNSFPNSPVTKPPETVDYIVEDNDIFITTHVAGSEPIHAALWSFTSRTQLREPNYGKASVTLPINGLLPNMLPPLHNWYVNNLPEYSDYAYGWANDWADEDTPGLDLLAEDWAMYRQWWGLNGMWIVGGPPEAYQSEVTGASYITRGFQGINVQPSFDPDNPECVILGNYGWKEWKLRLHYNSPLTDEHKEMLDGACDKIRAIAKENPGKPLFIPICVCVSWHSRGGRYEGARYIMDNLVNNPEGRSYHFVGARDIAETWKTWKRGGKGSKPAPDPSVFDK